MEKAKWNSTNKKPNGHEQSKNGPPSPMYIYHKYTVHTNNIHWACTKYAKASLNGQVKYKYVDNQQRNCGKNY